MYTIIHEYIFAVKQSKVYFNVYINFERFLLHFCNSCSKYCNCLLLRGGILCAVKTKGGKYLAKKKLNEKEKLFCLYLSEHRTPREAAALAGYSAPLVTGLKLSSNPLVRSAVEELRQSADNSGEVAEGLRRIAFGGIADIVRLATAPDITALDIDKLDLQMLQEIKFTKNGVEVKLFDRIRALEKLSEVKPDEVPDQSFFEALQNSVQDGVEG